MKKVVLTIMDNVCAANGKDVNATELINVMKLWGKVTPFDEEVEKERAEWQKVVDDLNAQLNTSKAHEAATGEMVILNAIREYMAKIGADYETRIGALEGQLEDIRVEEQSRVEQIMALLTKK